MALIKCPECGKEVSDKAKVCIQCGCKLHKEQSVLGIIGFALSVLQLFFGIYGLLLSIPAFILSSIGCFEKDKKHLFGIIGNIISFIFVMMCIVLFIVLAK